MWWTTGGDVDWMSDFRPHVSHYRTSSDAVGAAHRDEPRYRIPDSVVANAIDDVLLANIVYYLESGEHGQGRDCWERYTDRVIESGLIYLWDAGIDTPHAPDVCPLVQGTVDNAAALVAATGVVISVANLLPVKILRMLPRSVLDAIKAQVQRPTAVFDFHQKSTKDVFQAAVSGHVSVEEALVWLQGKLLSASKSDEVNKISIAED